MTTSAEKQLGKLRDFSTQLAERLRSAPEQGSAPLRLAIRIGSNSYLVDMSSSAEVVDLPEISRVPWTQAWYRGLANVRGRLVGIVDLPHLTTGKATPDEDSQQILVINESLNTNLALLMTRAFGLRNIATLERLEPIDGAPPWEGVRYRDLEGTVMTELNLGRLIASEVFSSISV